MEFFDVLARRFACRAFCGQVTDSQLERLKEAVQQAPSAFNSQYLRYTFITDPKILDLLNRSIWAYYEDLKDLETLDRLKSRHESALYGAPLCVVITGPDKKYSPFDAGIAAQTLALSATALGLGSVICAANGVFPGGPLGSQVMEALALPEDHAFQLSVLIGPIEQSKEPHSYDGHQIVSL